MGEAHGREFEKLNQVRKLSLSGCPAEARARIDAEGSAPSKRMVGWPCRHILAAKGQGLLEKYVRLKQLESTACSRIDGFWTGFYVGILGFTE